MGTGRKPRSPKSPQAIKLREKVLEAVKLRRGGAIYEDIAKAQKCSVSTAHDRVAKGLAEIGRRLETEAGHALELDLARLDSYLVNLGRGLAAGDPRSINAALRVLERRAKLLGLDAPTQVEDVTDPEKARARVDEILRRAAERDGSSDD